MSQVNRKLLPSESVLFKLGLSLNLWPWIELMDGDRGLRAL